MQRLPPDPRYYPPNDRLTWQTVLVSYTMLAAIPLLLWVVSYPLVGSAVLAAVVGLFIVARRASELVRCFYECQRFTFDLGRTVQITVTRCTVDDPN